MHYSPQNEECPMALNPFKACVAPRPIGWISTVSRDGIDNLAPFSQFQNLSYDPPMVMIAINQGGDEPDHVHRKDTVNNIESTGCFVYNAVPYDLKEQMNITASGFAPEEDEFEKAGLHKADSIRVAAKRVAESPIQFECEYMQTIHVADEIILPNGKLDYRKLRLIGRAGYWDYGVMEDTFAMKVPGVSAARMAAMEGRKPNEADLEKDKKENSL